MDPAVHVGALAAFDLWNDPVAKADRAKVLAAEEEELGFLPGFEKEGWTNLPGRCGVGIPLLPSLHWRLEEALKKNPDDLFCPDCGKTVFEPHCLRAVDRGECENDGDDSKCDLCSYALEFDHMQNDHMPCTATCRVRLPVLFTPRTKYALRAEGEGQGLWGIRHYCTYVVSACKHCADLMCAQPEVPVSQDDDDADGTHFRDLIDAMRKIDPAFANGEFGTGPDAVIVERTPEGGGAAAPEADTEDKEDE